MTRQALSALLSHWRRHPGQLLTLVLGLALATALWTGVQAINAEARASYDRAAQALAANDLPRLVPAEDQDLTLETYVALRRAGWPVAPVVEGTWSVGGRSYRLIGLDPLTAPALPAPVTPHADPADALRAFLTPPGEIRGARESLDRLRAAHPGPRYVESADLPPGTLVADIGIAADLLGLSGRISHLVLLSPTTLDLHATAPELRHAPPETGADIVGLTRSFHLNLTAFGFLSFAVGLFIVHGAIGLAFEQRRAMVRTLRALGLPLPRLMALMAAEALVFALLAGAVGVALGYVLAALLLPDVAATLRGLYGAPVSGTLSVRAAWWGAGLAMAVGGASLATADSLWSLARMGILAPARPRAWAIAHDTRLRALAGVGGLCLGAAAILTWGGTGLAAGFAALAGLLLGAALCLPLGLSLLLRLAETRARRPVTEWLWADARQQVPGLSLALMALLLALSANIGVSTMVASFRTTFEGWLDQRLAAEAYLRFDSPTAAAQAMPWLVAHTDAVLPIPRTEADLDGRPGTVYGMRDHATYHDAWPLLTAVPDAWTRLKVGQGAFINEQWSYMAGLSPGDRAEIDGRAVEILGIYSDYGNPSPQAILGIAPFRAAYPGVPEDQFALRLGPSSAGLAEIADTLGLRPDQITDQASLKAGSRQVFERTFAATDALNVLTLVVAGFAIFASLTTLQNLRLPQVAPLWALGVTRRRLALLELGRSVVLAFGTALLALPTGLALAWLLLARVNVWAFGWRLPMQAFPEDWAVLILAALGTAGLAAALPAWRLARHRPADLLRVFSHVR